MEEILRQVKKIHLVGIGGAGMSGLAFLLQDKGFFVQGSDIQPTSKIELLRERGIKVYLNHNKNNIDSDIDLVCYSSAVGFENEEIREAGNRGIRIVKRGCLLAYLCRNTDNIAVAGSHGKTTVVSLLSHILKASGCNPIVFAGGLPVDGSFSASWGRGPSIIETDESDGTFLECRPRLSVITNIDKEHLNYYKSFANLKKSFLSFARNTSEKVFGCCDQKKVRSIIDKTGGVSFGFGRGSSFRAKNFSAGKKFTYFDLYKDEKRVSSLRIPFPGRHNCLNALAALSVADYLGIGFSCIKKCLEEFGGVRRRFQIKAEAEGVIFIDDYAHHPTEISSTLAAAASLAGRRLFVIMQPHRPSRVKLLLKEFSRCLKGADCAVITDIYKASESFLPDIDSLRLVEEIKKTGFKNVAYMPKNKLKSQIPAMIKEKDIVIGLGAGDINKELAKVIREFRKHKTQKKY